MERKVITAEHALALNGLTCSGVRDLKVLTTNPYLDRIYNHTYVYYYCNEIDTENYAIKYKDSLLLPTVERAIVDYIRMEDIRDEGTLIWAIQDYIDSSKYDMNKVYEVAEFYNVPKEVIDYWFKEAREEPYYSMG